MEHPSTILEPNLDSNAIPTLTLHLTLHLTLIKTEYWDRAGGGGHISYEWGGTPMSHTLKAVDTVESAPTNGYRMRATQAIVRQWHGSSHEQLT